MMFKTHLSLGVLAGLFFMRQFSLEDPWIFLAIVGFSSILPDIDTKNSWIGKRFKPISWLFSLLFGHRKIFHSILFALFIFIVLYFLTIGYIAAAFLIGYVVHILVDGFTVNGIKPFYPFSKFEIKGFLRSGDLMDNLLFFLIIVGIIWLSIG
jgi:inner membrane protein